MVWLLSTIPKVQNSDKTWLSRPCVPGVKTLSTVSPVILTQEQWSIWIVGCKNYLVFALCLSLLLLWGFEAPRVLILLCFLSWATIKIERHIVKAVRSVSLYFWQLCITKVPPASGCPWQSRSLSKFRVSWASLSPRWECLKHKGLAWDHNHGFKIYVTGSKCIILTKDLTVYVVRLWCPISLAPGSILLSWLDNSIKRPISSWHS